MLKLLKRLTAKEWLAVLLSVAFVAGQVYLELRIPDFMTNITSLIPAGGTAAEIWNEGAKMLACALGSLALAIIVGFFAARISAGFASNLRLEVFRKVLSFSMGEVNRFSTASLITRSTNDVVQVQFLIAMGMQVVLRAPIMAVWALVKIAGKGTSEWTLATGVAVIFIVLVISFISTLVVPRFRKIQTLTDNLNAITRENLTGLRVVRAYNAEKYQESKFRKANRALTGNYLFTTRTMSFMMPCMNLVMSGLPLSVYWIGSSLIDRAQALDKLTLFSNMVVFSSYAMQVVMSFVMMVFIFVMLPRVLVSARRINEVLDTPSSVLDGPGLAEISQELKGTVEFRDVSFKYPGAEDYVLKNISFKAERGETVAFIGSTGSGKSTIVNLIPRFYDATEGTVLVDGVDVRQYTLRQLRDRLGYIPQRSVMFSGTVSSNIAFGDNGKPEPEIEQIKYAAKIAQGDEFINKMEEGYDSRIAQGGANVSGGQKQRLSIARAVCREPEIFIFDDSFSALDFKTDKQLRRALNEELSDSTRLIVAQRIGTIRDADKIIVLENGQTVGIGTHDELMRDCQVYREIAYSQLSEEELKNA
ncbi:MAG: ABC transporter ATP-binding protein/permease [Oscillospiraceae bacterium]|jgi:ATP-binding cassette subfamily B protein|nr:ABC transporter ATP-binding protein/permease [Oscillospiraceae bacterium]